MEKLLRNKLFIHFLYIISAVYIFLIWVWGAETKATSFNGDPHSMLSDLIYGTAHKPYVHRALLPLLTRLIYSFIPKSISTSIENNLLSISKMQKEIMRLGWENNFLFEYLIILFLSLVSLIIFLYVFKNLFKYFYDTKKEVTNIIPILALFCLPIFFHEGTHYIYDFPALLFFTLGLLFLLKNKYFLFYLIYIVGLSNKETILFLSAAFLLLHFDKMETKKLIKHLLIQIIIFIAIKSILIYIFYDNPGEVAMFALHINIHQMLLPYTLNFLIEAVLILVLIFYKFKDKPDNLKRLTLLIIPFGVVYLFFGRINEIRALYEIFPIFFLIIIHTILFSILKINYKIKI